jgi:predicted transcriptional regulator
MGTVPADVLFDSLSPEAQKRVQERAAKEIAEYKVLQVLRKQLGFTQSELADIMDLAQNNISEMEARSDMRLSTLKGYIEALGCKMQIVVTKPDSSEVRLGSLINEDIGA